MAISDLTGTTWTLNSTISQFNNTGSGTNSTYDINFISNNTTYDRIYALEWSTVLTRAGGGDGPPEPEPGGGENFIKYYSTSPYIETTAVTGTPGTGICDTWTNEAYKIIQITGGTDATDATLIAWFEANATQVIRSDAYITTDTDLTKVANAIRSKLGSGAALQYPFTPVINSMVTGSLQSRTVTFDSPGSTRVSPQSGYIGMSEVELIVNISGYDGEYTYTPAANLISFTINNVNSYAESGMTWTEWCSSQYNDSDSIGINNGYVKLYQRQPNGTIDWSVMAIATSGGVAVAPGDTITNDNYTFIRVSSSNPGGGIVD